MQTELRSLQVGFSSSGAQVFRSSSSDVPAFIFLLTLPRRPSSVLIVSRRRSTSQCRGVSCFTYRLPSFLAFSEMGLHETESLIVFFCLYPLFIRLFKVGLVNKQMAMATDALLDMDSAFASSRAPLATRRRSIAHLAVFIIVAMSSGEWATSSRSAQSSFSPNSSCRTHVCDGVSYSD